MVEYNLKLTDAEYDVLTRNLNGDTHLDSIDQLHLQAVSIKLKQALPLSIVPISGVLVVKNPISEKRLQELREQWKEMMKDVNLNDFKL